MLKLFLASAVLAAPVTAFAQTTPAMPQAVPLYPNAKVVEQSHDADGDVDATLTTGSSVAQVRSWYEQRMRAAGVTPEVRTGLTGKVTLRGRDARNRYEVEIERERNLTEIDIEVDRLP